MSNIVLVEGARTAFTEIAGTFRGISATDLGAEAARGAIRKANINPEEIDQVVFANVQQSSKDAHLLARHVGLKAGLPIHVPALTINRLCGSGIEAILTAARYILT
jgi:acetyl-CoA acyltransferase 2